MPTRNDVFTDIIKSRTTAQDQIRRNYLKELSEYTKRDTILYASAFTTNKYPNISSTLVSITPEDIQGFMSAVHNLKGKELDLILHSPGGSLEVADQIVQYLKSKYENIRAIIPQNAMSAATMIVCACDVIVMGKHSAIGPIDPQITMQTESGQFTAPAQSLLDEFERAKNEILDDPKTAIIWASKMRSYPPGFLKYCEDTIALSVEKVSEWLIARMFKDETDANIKSKNIAEWLGKKDNHKTHGRPINYTTAKEKGLKIFELEDDQHLQEKVLSVFHATMATFEITHCTKFVENQIGNGMYTKAELRTG
jgi:ATP-dependent protease ClpP protease subunit